MPQDLTTDVLVIGGGPAGSMTAKWAAKSGAHVLMIEKRQEIGSPVRCGEGMSKDWLPEVGIVPSNRWINVEVEGARIYSPREQVFEINEKHAGNEVGYVVERDSFDKQLAIDAANAGRRCHAQDRRRRDAQGQRQDRRSEGQAVRRALRHPGQGHDRGGRVRVPGRALGWPPDQPGDAGHGYLPPVPHDERRLRCPLL